MDTRQARGFIDNMRISHDSSGADSAKVVKEGAVCHSADGRPLYTVDRAGAALYEYYTQLRNEGRGHYVAFSPDVVSLVFTVDSSVIDNEPRPDLAEMAQILDSIYGLEQVIKQGLAVLDFLEDGASEGVDPQTLVDVELGSIAATNLSEPEKAIAIETLATVKMGIINTAFDYTRPTRVRPGVETQPLQPTTPDEWREYCDVAFRTALQALQRLTKLYGALKGEEYIIH